MSYTYHNARNFAPMNLLKVRISYKIMCGCIHGLFFAVGGLFFILVAPIIWCVNRLFSPGPLFYWQTRVGLHETEFSMLKFRSMRTDAEADVGAIWAEEDDSRVTPIGQILRKTHLDELPQIWNILRGEMNLIGPRPERPEFISQLVEEIPRYALRHTIKPGLTGLAQVSYGYGASVKDARIKLHYDLLYLQHRSWKLDRAILWATLRQIVGKKMNGNIPI